MLEHYRPVGMMNMTRGLVALNIAAREGVPKENYFDLSPEDKAKLVESFQPMWDKWVEDMNALGYPAQSILDDAVSLMEAYRYG